MWLGTSAAMAAKLDEYLHGPNENDAGDDIYIYIYIVDSHCRMLSW